MLSFVDCVGERHAFGGNGAVFWGSAESVSDELVREYSGKIQLIYLDPPLGAGLDLQLKHGKPVQSFPGGHSNTEIVELMRHILTRCKELLCASGSIYLHTDYRMSGHMRMLMDEVFMESNLMNEIVWEYKPGGRSTKFFPRKHDIILFYRKSPKVYFNISSVGKPRGAQRRNHLKRAVDDAGRIYFSIKSGGKEYRYYEDDLIFPGDVWDDIESLHQRDCEHTGYAAQKPEALLGRIIRASSKEDDLVLDLFGGSGTTSSVAAQLNRRFIAVDCSFASLFVTRKRLLEPCLNAGMLKSDKPLDIHYRQHSKPKPDSSALLNELFTVSYMDDGTAILTARGGEGSLEYAAFGTICDGVFLATDYLMRQCGDFTIKLKRESALHIVDSSFRQAFVLNH